MKKNKKKDTITTIIGPDVRIDGLIEFQGTIRVDGHIKGRIKAENGMVIVGEKAVIQADIIVNEAIIRGEVTGTVETLEKVEIYPPARIIGNIRSPLAAIASGVMIDGTCSVSRPGPTEETELP